jgi:hypothetical protein
MVRHLIGIKKTFGSSKPLSEIFFAGKGSKGTFNQKGGDSP